MDYRRIGSSGLKTSVIALGNWLTYGTVTENESAKACVRKAYELGINHFDSAIVYGNKPHEGESVLGEYVREFPRSSYILTSKIFWPIGPSQLDGGNNRKHMFDQIDLSLKALGTDYIDIFYCHRYDPNTDLEETLRALDDLVASGKIRYAAVSEWKAHQLTEAKAIEKRLGLRKFIANQPQYNMLQRQHEDDVIPVMEKEGIGLIAFSPLAQGLLTGKYTPGQPAPAGSRGAVARTGRWVNEMLNNPSIVERLNKLTKVANDAGIPLAEMALAWLLTRPTVSAALVGATRPEQVEQNVRGGERKLSADVLAAINEALA